jgi:hypothetical protein
VERARIASASALASRHLAPHHHRPHDVGQSVAIVPPLSLFGASIQFSLSVVCRNDFSHTGLVAIRAVA